MRRMPRVAKQDAPGADDGLKSLVKIVRILDCFSTTRRSLSLTELCAATGYPISCSPTWTCTAKRAAMWKR
jgi:hypothetical protein